MEVLYFLTYFLSVWNKDRFGKEKSKLIIPCIKIFFESTPVLPCKRLQPESSIEKMVV